MDLLHLEGPTTPRRTCYTVCKKKIWRVTSEDTSNAIIAVAFSRGLLLLCYKPSVIRKAWSGMIEHAKRNDLIKQLPAPTFSIGLDTCVIVCFWLLLLSVFFFVLFLKISTIHGKPRVKQTKSYLQKKNLLVLLMLFCLLSLLFFRLLFP